MRNIDRIHYQGRCDRAHCAKQYNHSHPPLGEPTTETDTVYVVTSKYNPETESFREDNILIEEK